MYRGVAGIFLRNKHQHINQKIRLHNLSTYPDQNREIFGLCPPPISRDSHIMHLHRLHAEALVDGIQGWSGAASGDPDAWVIHEEHQAHLFVRALATLQ